MMSSASGGEAQDLESADTYNTPLSFDAHEVKLPGSDGANEWGGFLGSKPTC